MKTVALLINVGSPDQPTVPAVRRYLAQFLMDKYILDIPWVWRVLLVYGVILPTRSSRSAEAYHAIWGPDGSPLVTLTDKLVKIITQSSPIPVTFAMRCGNPNIESTVKTLNLTSSDELLVIPMYPQYAESTTRSAVEAVIAALPTENGPTVRIKKPFYGDDSYLDIWAELIAETPGDYTLFSFHGLPVRHLKKADPTGSHCLASQVCCNTPSEAHATCYRHQCMVTADKIAQRLGLAVGTWSVSFQSRLGRDEWLSPATDAEFRRLPQAGQTNIRVVCASFTTDCLETLEEIHIEGKKTFLAAGGQMFKVVPCPNTNPKWAQLLTRWIADGANSDFYSRLTK